MPTLAATRPALTPTLHRLLYGHAIGIGLGHGLGHHLHLGHLKGGGLGGDDVEGLLPLLDLTRHLAPGAGVAPVQHAAVIANGALDLVSLADPGTHRHGDGWAGSAAANVAHA